MTGPNIGTQADGRLRIHKPSMVRRPDGEGSTDGVTNLLVPIRSKYRVIFDRRGVAGGDTAKGRAAAGGHSASFRGKSRNQGSVRVGWESRLHEGSILIRALPCVRLLPNRSKIKEESSGVARLLCPILLRIT